MYLDMVKRVDIMGIQDATSALKGTLPEAVKTSVTLLN